MHSSEAARRYTATQTVAQHRKLHISKPVATFRCADWPWVVATQPGKTFIQKNTIHGGPRTTANVTLRAEHVEAVLSAL